jgi:hypothetical protein
MPMKAYKLYSSFEGWIKAHEKYSSLSVQYALEDTMADPENAPIKSLKSYISRLRDMRTEINSEIRNSEDWIEYFRRKNG